MARLNRVRQLTPANLRGLSFGYLYLIRAGWRLFVRKDRLDRWLSGAPSAGPTPVLSSTELRNLRGRARWVNAAARYPLPWARCLQRSLALCLWLEQQGFRAQLKIGVSKTGNSLDAHAWVEYKGHVLNDSPHVKERFVTLEGGSAHLLPMGR